MMQQSVAETTGVSGILNYIQMDKKIAILLFMIFCCFQISVFAQSSDSLKLGKTQSVELSQYSKLAELNDKGIEITKDSLVLGKEFRKVLNDENYRAMLYPETYSWQQAVDFIQSQELKKAFWYFINLYPENDVNKELVIKSILTYDRLFKMDEIIVNTFYTYCFMDPKVSKIIDGKPEIFRPDLLESKLRNVKEIVSYIRYNRKMLAEKANKE